MSFIKEAILRQFSQLDIVVQDYVLLLQLLQFALAEYVDQRDVIEFSGVDDEVTELGVEGEPVEVHRAGDLHPGQHTQLHQWDSTHVVEGESFVEVKTTSVILGVFHMLNLIGRKSK